MTLFATSLRRRAAGALMGLALMAGGGPLAAQGLPIDGDLAAPGSSAAANPAGGTGTATTATDTPAWASENGTPMPAEHPAVTSGDASQAASQASANPSAAASEGKTYKRDDLVGAAEGLFGKGAEGLARMIESVLAKQGEPNAYIVGREGGGALVVGLR